MQNLREREIHMLNKLLSLQNSDTQEEFVDYWKVLIYDEHCRDIISPLMNVAALRQKGVTLHLMLHSSREPVLDAPAVYFICPTKENLQRIVEDCTKKLYRSTYIHFLTRIDRELLEQFAQDLVTANATNQITKIYDEYLDFIAVEPSLFTLNIKNSYIGYNSPALTESNIKEYMDKTTMGLLSMVRVLGTLPIIRAAPGGAAEMCAQGLYTALSENINPRGPAYNLFSECLVSSSSSGDYSNNNTTGNEISTRPLLLIFDRSSDMSPPLMHTSSYQALIDDLLDYKLNRVTIDVLSKDKEMKKKTYDVNTVTDVFFGKYASSSFPDAVEANEKELGEISKQEADIRSRSSTSSVDTNNNNSDSLGKDIENLPEILNRKANLEAHTNILQAIMKKIASREIPTFFEMENSLINSTGGIITDKTAIIELLNDPLKGNINDKIRLLILITITLANSSTNTNDYKASNSNIIKTTIENEYEDAFVTGCIGILSKNNETDSNINVDYTEIEEALGTVSFIRKSLNLSSPLNYMRNVGNNSANSDAFSSLFSTASTQITSHATNLIAKATNFFSKFSPMFITKVVESLSEGRNCDENDTYCYLDAKAKLTNNNNINKNIRYSDVIVFVIGGGCYNEYFNLQELLNHKLAASGGGNSSTPVINSNISGNHTYFPRNILYGGSELLSGDKFLEQLNHLGNNNKKI